MTTRQEVGLSGKRWRFFMQRWLTRCVKVASVKVFMVRESVESLIKQGVLADPEGPKASVNNL